MFIFGIEMIRKVSQIYIVMAEIVKKKIRSQNRLPYPPTVCAPICHTERGKTLFFNVSYLLSSVIMIR